MRFMMFVANDPEPDVAGEALPDIETWFDAVNRRGKWIDGDRLRPAADAKTVRVRAGKVLVNDGPMTPAMSQIVGFDILECNDLEEAIEIASSHPMARAGRIELRRFWPLDT